MSAHGTEGDAVDRELRDLAAGRSAHVDQGEAGARDLAKVVGGFRAQLVEDRAFPVTLADDLTSQFFTDLLAAGWIEPDDEGEDED